MKTVEIKIYELSELSEIAQKKAHETWLEDWDYDHMDHMFQNFESVLTHSIGIDTGINWEIDACGYTYAKKYIHMFFAEGAPSDRQKSLKRDYRKFDAFRDSIREHVDVEDFPGYYIGGLLSNDAYRFMGKLNMPDYACLIFDTFFEYWRADIECRQSFEYFAETSSANDWHYLEDGTLWTK